jgi:hypothetical protein
LTKRGIEEKGEVGMANVYGREWPQIGGMRNDYICSNFTGGKLEEMKWNGRI